MIEDSSLPQPSDSETKRLAIFIGLFFAVWTIRAVVFTQFDRAFQPDWLRRLWYDEIRLLVWVVPVFIYLAKVDRVRPLRFLRLKTAGENLFQASLVTALFFSVVIAFEYFVENRTIGRAFDLSLEEWINLVWWLPFACWCEEVLFRGFIQQKLRLKMNFVGANLLTSVLFVAIHWPGWIMFNGFGASLVTLSAGVFFISLLLGYLLEETRSLWPCVAAHVLNNVIAGLMAPR